MRRKHSWKNLYKPLDPKITQDCILMNNLNLLTGSVLEILEEQFSREFAGKGASRLLFSQFCLNVIRNWQNFPTKEGLHNPRTPGTATAIILRILYNFNGDQGDFSQLNKQCLEHAFYHLRDNFSKNESNDYSFIC